MSSVSIQPGSTSNSSTNITVTATTGNHRIGGTMQLAQALIVSGTNIPSTFAGNVGIGVAASPIKKLEMDTTTQTTDGIALVGSDSHFLYIMPSDVNGGYNANIAGGSAAIIYSNGSGGSGSLAIAPWSAGANGINLNSTGQVGLNTTFQDAALSVNGNADKNSGGTTWGTFSDIRLKNIDGPYTSGLAQIMQLQPVMFHYKPGNPLNLPSNEQNYGFIAQDVQKVMPEAVITSSNGYLQLSADPILWSMVNAIKEQQVEIASLSANLGSIGIGTTSPGAPLEINSTTANILALNGSNGSATRSIVVNTAGGSISSNIGASINFIDDGAYGANIAFSNRTGGVGTAQTERMRILTNGNVGQGVTVLRKQPLSAKRLKTL